MLGLQFDTSACTIAMPPVKIAKARRLVQLTYHNAVASVHQLHSLLGSLRHVATCIRAARPFLQRLRFRCDSASRHRNLVVTDDMRQDIIWWWQILHTPVLNGVPMRYFHSLPTRDVVVEMDASDYGLCALDTRRRRYFTYAFSQAEKQLIDEFKRTHDNAFNINYRELLSAALAVLLWGEQWSLLGQDDQLHVHFRIDNTSAIAWQTKMCSRNSRAQVLLRVLGH